MADITLELDAFVRSFGINRNSAHTFFLGAGASISSGVPSAERCIWEWKRSIFLTNNPGLEQQFGELSLAGVRQKIQHWLDKRGSYPVTSSEDEYGFYIEKCFPIPADRRIYFQEKVREASPHLGYRLLCHLAQEDIVRCVWTTNFDGLVARAAANFSIVPIEIGIDSQERLPRLSRKGELICVSLHGDYRYDALKNTPEEVQRQELQLRSALIEHLQDTPLIVVGYSGRDSSIMAAFKSAYSKGGSASLYWCGFANEPSESVQELLQLARQSGREAFYVTSQGFDDLLLRLALHCLQGTARTKAQECISELVGRDAIGREAFRVERQPTCAIIKSNAFEVECPSEVLQLELKSWPDEKVWSWVRTQVHDQDVVAVPFRGKILALGLVDDVKAAFELHLKGPIQRVPVSPDDLRYEDGAIISLLREALVRALSSQQGVSTNGRTEIWLTDPLKLVQEGGNQYQVHESVSVFLRRIGETQYLILKPSVRVLTLTGETAPQLVANAIKLSILGWQHNKPFNQAMNKWRTRLLPDHGGANDIEFPVNSGSRLKYRLKRAPIFAEIQSTKARGPIQVPDKLRNLIKHTGFQLDEPELLFSNKNGTTPVKDMHPIRGILNNRPFDYALTVRGLVPSVKIGVICPQPETDLLRAYLTEASRHHQPSQRERDYLLDYPGFAHAYGLPLDLPDPQMTGWIPCPEPSSTEPRAASRELGTLINRSIETLESKYGPSVVLIFVPDRWESYRGYRTDTERFDLHDFVKAFSVQRGVATQFLNQSTLRDQYQCRVWWWLSLAMYAKSMRTPWVLDGLDQDTAFVGLGFSVEPAAQQGQHVVLGCSHIYSARGEGLQYRLSKLENPIFRGKNPFMSKDDARRLGETIRYMFYESRLMLPRRVVIHKHTPFLKNEREGIHEGLSGVTDVDLIEIYEDHALRYVASVFKNGKFDDDNYPVARGTTIKLDDYSALIWVHGVTASIHPTKRYYQGKRRIPTPLMVRRHAGRSDLRLLAQEILGLSKMNWNTFDLYTNRPATIHSSSEIARIGSLLQRFGRDSYDFRLFM